MAVHDVLGVAFRKRQDLQLHPLQLFEWQILEQSSTGRGQVMLHWIGEGEEIAARVFQAVPQRDQLLPTVDRDQPAESQIALELFSFDSEIDHVAVRPDERMKRLDVGGC